ncbi:MAG: diaminopimelate epimerase [Gammaproteobacteria bacterium]|nr:diaminopimelate epimerase [Gammaproteobacteria bacterium]
MRVETVTTARQHGDATATAIRFTKMQGLGNDFIVIDATHQPVTFEVAQIRRLADRRLGIGCDQLLLLEPAAGDETVRCRIYNADGSEAGHCGNGMRCVARYLLDRQPDLDLPLRIGLRQGMVRAEPTADGAIRVAMGVPRFDPDAIPLRVATPAATYRLEVLGTEVEFGAVSLGNPHAVLVVADTATAPVATLGAAIECHPTFPERVNVGFMQIVSPHRIRLRVFERGVGETPACGSGACAAAVLGIAHGQLQSPVAVELPGGELCIEWAGASTNVWMTGPAVTVFAGEIEP